MNLCIITVSTTVLTTIPVVLEKINSQMNQPLDLNLHYAASNFSNDEYLRIKEDICTSDAIIVDLMGSPKKIVEIVYESLETYKGQVIPIGESARDFMKLGSFKANDKMMQSTKKPDMKKIRKMITMAEKIGKIIPGKIRDMRNLSYITKYFKNATFSQLESMLCLLLKYYGEVPSIQIPEEPIDVMDVGICDPFNRKFHKNYASYVKNYGYNPTKPNIGILFYGHTYPNDTSFAVHNIVEKLKSLANIIPIGFTKTSGNDPKEIKKLLTYDKKVNMIISFLPFRIGAGPMGGDAEGMVDLFKELNVPLFHPFFLSRRTIEDWEKSSQGIHSSEFMLSIMLPEMDGAIETYPVGALSSKGVAKNLHTQAYEMACIDARVEKLVNRIKSWLSLQSKKNSEKKIAIIGYNYPPGEDHLFHASYLDTFASISEILKTLKKEGYKLKELDEQSLQNTFLEKGLINSPKYFYEKENYIHYKSENYMDSVNNFSPVHDVIKEWGNAPGSIMATEKDFFIPGIINENIFIGLQPSKGIIEDENANYHDKNMTPHHQYLAFYQWLKNDFHADVILHIGTHGTLEFLPGKECGMSQTCYSDYLIGDIPHGYIYYCGNPSEGMIAKRRSHAVLIGYQPPAFTTANLYADYTKLESLIGEYHESLHLSPDRSKDLLDAIFKIGDTLHFEKDLDTIEKELYKMKSSLMPKGLHIFGKAYSNTALKSLFSSILQYDRGEIKSLKRIVAEKNHLNYDEIMDKNQIHSLKLLDEEVKTILDTIDLNAPIDNPLLSIYGKELQKTFDYGLSICNKIKQNHENKGLIKFLNGEYLPAKIGGDPIRNPDVLPSGYNLYQFDSRFIPSSVAMLRGQKIAQNTLNTYYELHGKYPKVTSVILWGLETCRTQGETLGQILYYLGVRMKNTINIWEPEFEIIPIEELNRPRIDVVVNICGFFRDMFENIIILLNEIFENIDQLGDENGYNYFHIHTKKLYNDLLNESYEKEMAAELAHSRIFGPSQSQYGTQITSLIKDKSWREESEIGKSFIESMRYIYSKNYRGIHFENLYEKNLSMIELISQVRSNHEYQIVDLDHYYEFFGGLSKSIETIRGKKSEMFISDTTTDHIETEKIEKSIERGIRTRLLNPKWIEEMLKHKYHGTTTIADRFENIQGLAATTNKIDQWIYHSLHDQYVMDEALKNQLKENNPYAYLEIIKQMLEYAQRGYWQASDDQVNELHKTFLELEGDIEDQ
ncbi:cobaltochelatase subunit CobN [Crassaminicella profunda]|uniref:cobaltochelatase subunit CobN n=1 Tax=Crassaminicella profunda TaxID=1286698 RepID=UPI001CA6357E|nr:cobaltochelatase subunit CobN [Crassaminicella profunda]QZY55861.1 cobaltochelatase subunit CobN [Crassaminicella profunda]